MTAKRTDANQPEIVKRYRQHGCSVESLHKVGNGVPDLLVGVAGITDLAEVKDGNKAPSARKLTPDQDKWHAEWSGSKRVVKSLEEVDEHVADMRHRAKYIGGFGKWAERNGA